MHRNNQSRRWLPALAYTGGVAALLAVVGFSALVQSRTQPTESVSCDVLPVIRAVDAAQGATPERLTITVVGKRTSDIAGARPAATQVAKQS